MEDPLDDPLVKDALEAFCREHGLDINNLPAGLEPADLLERVPVPAVVRPKPEGKWSDEWDAVQAGDQSRRASRPRKDGPQIPWPEIDRLMVYGETYEEGGRTLHRYPSLADLSARYNVHRKTLKQYQDRNRVAERRAAGAERTEQIVAEAMATTAAAAQVRGREKLALAIEIYADKFIEAVRTDKVALTVDGLNTLARLGEFLGGGADQRSEKTHTLRLEDLQDRFRTRQQVIDVQPVNVGLAQPNDKRGDMLAAMTPQAARLPAPDELDDEDDDDGGPDDDDDLAV